MYAVIESGGRQYRVSPGDVLELEKIEGEVGKKLTFDKILLVGGNQGQVLVGTPYVSSANTHAEIVEQTKGEKLFIVRYRRRKNFRKTQGHRQLLTRVLVTRVEDGKGGSLEFDAAKRLETLRQANIRTSDRWSAAKAPKAPKKVAAVDAAPKAEAKVAAAKKAAGSSKTKSAGTKAKTTKK